MRNFVLISAVSVLSLSVALPAKAVEGATLDQRVKRLERMLENPVLLQLSRRLGEQQRDIQSLQDENDRLKRELKNLRSLMDKRYKESDERFSALEGGVAFNKNQDERAGSRDSSMDSSADSDPSKQVQVAVTPSAQKGGVSDNSKADSAVKDSVNENSITENSKATEAASDSVNVASATLATADKPVAATEGQAVSMPIKTRTPTELEKEQYKEAFALMRASKYEASIKSFQEFLNNYPESDLASNAAYWSGEGYLIKDQNQAALDAFMLVIERYPDSSKVPDAKLRAGDAYDRLGQITEAKKLYQDIIDSRPHSKAAKNAQKRLESY
ncbi:hypothetical protein THMIRHAM_13840 [Thiomicrorhabdus immobilis]|uniref:Cell division coordinator CpoB n=1 Tax=Thiomicrorhabdus immobilis TaxID=2791037 RepID=A0ABN6CY36_9GAMM|nr:tol-pal system protein YbgF [Thiomicrorhabdus immobilis]BCN93599.1 hypothetical protein THMIRHAM_13840 [Thiomicrorhabdus immobilis]